MITPWLGHDLLPGSCIPTHNSGLILDLRPANERRRYKVTTSLIGCAQTKTQSCRIWLRISPCNTSLEIFRFVYINDTPVNPITVSRYSVELFFDTDFTLIFSKSIFWFFMWIYYLSNSDLEWPVFKDLIGRHPGQNCLQSHAIYVSVTFCVLISNWPHISDFGQHHQHQLQQQRTLWKKTVFVIVFSTRRITRSTMRRLTNVLHVIPNSFYSDSIPADQVALNFCISYEITANMTSTVHNFEAVI